MIWSGSLFSKTIVIGSGSLFSKTIVIVSGSILRGPSVSLTILQVTINIVKNSWYSMMNLFGLNDQFFTWVTENLLFLK